MSNDVTLWMQTLMMRPQLKEVTMLYLILLSITESLLTLHPQGGRRCKLMKYSADETASDSYCKPWGCLNTYYYHLVAARTTGSIPKKGRYGTFGECRDINCRFPCCRAAPLEQHGIKDSNLQPSSQDCCLKFHFLCTVLCHCFNKKNQFLP